MVCEPFAAPVVFQEYEMELELVFEATCVPSMNTCMLVTVGLSGSEAVAVTVVVPETVAPFAGAVTLTTGGVVSGVPVVIDTDTSSRYIYVRSPYPSP